MGIVNSFTMKRRMLFMFFEIVGWLNVFGFRLEFWKLIRISLGKMKVVGFQQTLKVKAKCG